MNLSDYKEEKEHRIKRLIWIVVNCTIFKILPGAQLRHIRNLILKAFGAKLPLDVMVYNSAKIFAPWNLEMRAYSCIGPNVYIYNKAKITIGKNSVISQDSTLCTASHDITDARHPLITAPIVIEDQAWVAADAFVGMGVTIGQGAVVGARAAVFKDVAPWTVVGGNPAKFIKNRVIKDA